MNNNLITLLKRKIRNLLKLDKEVKKTQHTKANTKIKRHTQQPSVTKPYKQNVENKRKPVPKKFKSSNQNRVNTFPHKKPTTLILPELLPVPEKEDNTRFSDFSTIEKPILCGLQDAKFNYCTPIQALCLPHILEMKDIAGKAQTGTGKTAAFLVSIFSYLLKNPPKVKSPGFCRVLIIAPTRELAIQIHKDAEQLGKYCKLKNAVVYGGMDYQKQQQSLQKHIDILVGTPGRLLDYAQKRVLNLMKTEIFVIDEADRMLDMGFIPDVRRIVSQLPAPEKRHTMLFSATLSDDVLYLVKKWQVNPVMIEAKSEQIVTDLIEQTYYSVMQRDKKKLLKWLFKNDNISKCLIFVNRKDFTLQLKHFLQRQNVNCEILSGDVPQKKRLRILDQFRTGAIKTIIATDVASRGIHVDDISHVINYDLPERAEDYVHRIGRTGRAGKKGKSYSFICEYGAYVIPDLEKIMGEEIKSIQPEPEMLR